MNRNVALRNFWYAQKITFYTRLLFQSLIAMLCIFIIAGFICILLYTTGCLFRSKKPRICLSSDCHAIKDIYERTIDSSISPCNDFYGFVCNNYVKTLRDKGEYGSLADEITKKRYEEIISQLQIPPNRRIDSNLTILAKEFFNSCMNKDAILRKNHTQFINEFQESWPYMYDTYEIPKEKWKWINLFSNVFKRGILLNDFIQISIESNPDNPNQPILTLSPPFMKTFTIKERNEMRIDFINYVENHIQYLKLQDMKTYLNHAINFHDEILKSITTKSPTVYVRISSLRKRCYGFRWLRFINSVVPEEHQYHENEYISVVNLNFMDKLCEIMNNERKRKILFAYLMLKTFLKVAEITNRFETIAEIQDEKQQQYECSIETNKYLPIAVTDMYINSKNSKEDEFIRMELNNIVLNNLRTKFENIIDNSTEVSIKSNLLSPQSKLRAIKKLHAITVYFSNIRPNKTIKKERKHFQKLFTDLKLNDDVYENILRINKIKYKRIFEVRHHIPFTHKFITKSEIADSTIPRGFYYPNYIILTYPSFENPYFYYNGTDNYKYGGIGFMASQQYGHAFDNSNYQIIVPTDDDDDDEDDSYHTKTWDKESIENYKNKTHCLMNQLDDSYDNVTELWVNKTLTLDSAISDNIGIEVAFYSYRDTLKGKRFRKGEALPNLPYTPKQLFWMAVAVQLCEHRQKEYYQNVMKNSKEVKSDIRINNLVKNSQEFANVWKCPKDSPMNPIHKCSIFN